MKRCFSAALILALLGTTVAAPAWGEGVEVVSQNVEAEVAPAEAAGDTGLTVDEAQIAPEQTPEPAAEESDEAAALSDYAMIRAESAPVAIDAEGTGLLGAIPQGSVVLVTGDSDPARIALYTERGMLEGYVDGQCLARLTQAEAAAYMDAISTGAAVALYGDDLNAPLALVVCAFADETQGEETAEPEEATEPEAETAEAAETAEPAPEANESAEPTEQAEPAEQSEQTEEPAPALDVPAPEAEQPAEEDMAVMAATEAGEDEGPAQVAAAATGIQMSLDAVTIGVKESYALSVSGATGVTWRSSNAKYVAVDAATGVVTGVKKGSATVYAQAQDGSEAACKVTVKKAPGKVTVKPSTVTVGIGMSFDLPVTLPSGTASATLTYASGSTGVVAVGDDGRLKAVGTGTATVKVKTYNGKTAKCKVKVLPAPASISFPNPDFSVAVGQTAPLNAVALASDGSATQANITFAVDASSADAGCVTVDAATGSITGVRKGKAVVVATAQNGVVARCNVSVAAAPVSVSLNNNSIVIAVKENYAGLVAETIAPDGENECANAVTWTTSNKKVATVDANGRITGVKKGSCVITATTANGLKAKCKVSVKKAPKKVSISPKAGVLTAGTSGQFKWSFPKGTGSSVSFSSSDESVAVVDAYGRVTGVAAGTATITVTTANGKTAKASLTVKGAASVPSDSDDNKTSTTNAEKLEYVIAVAQAKLGKPYVYGSFGPNSFDCSGFTTYCFRQINIELKHSAHTQGYDESQQMIDITNLRRGDLVFFNTVSDGDDDLSDHSGIYLGDGKFIHASSSAGKVIVSNLASGYYNRVFSWGRRVLD